MALLYIGSAIFILVMRAEAIPSVLSAIFKAAFRPTAVAGGVSGTVIVSVVTAMSTGIARGIYTNEAGLGSSPIVSAASNRDLFR